MSSIGIEETDAKNKINSELYSALMIKQDEQKVIELCRKVPDHSLCVFTIYDDTVLHVAAYTKKSDLVMKLLDELPDQSLDKMTRQNKAGNTILHETASSNHALPVADKLFRKAPGLLGMRNNNGGTALLRAAHNGKIEIFNFLAGKNFSGFIIKLQLQSFKSSLKIQKYGSEKDNGEEGRSSGGGGGDVDIPLFLATKSGCVEIAKQILKVYPQSVGFIDHEGRNILHVANKYRQLEIFGHAGKMEALVRRLFRIDHHGNTILHMVGKERKDYLPEKTLVVQEDLLWYDIVNHRNNVGFTAEGLFDSANYDLRVLSKEWLIHTAEGCSVIAVLIATVPFAAAYTVPGGSNERTGYPILIHQPFFVVFTLSDVLSLTSPLAAVVTFLSVLTSSFRLEEFALSS
ncbi:hypothetical protein WN943_026306 [Citrus x changshan-huyou]